MILLCRQHLCTHQVESALELWERLRGRDTGRICGLRGYQLRQSMHDPEEHKLLVFPYPVPFDRYPEQLLFRLHCLNRRPRRTLFSRPMDGQRKRRERWERP